MNHKMESTDVCIICGISATKKCSACRQISYCSKEHQKDDWKIHKTKCKPYSVVENESKGRCLTASRNIKANEVIMKEDPLIIGPKFVSPSPVCLGCHKSIPSIHLSSKCSKCGWPVCADECEKMRYHLNECKFLALGDFKKGFKYELITPIRCLLEKLKNSKIWNVISNMEAHLKYRQKGTEIHKEVDDLFTYFKDKILKNDTNKMYNFITSNEFHRICGILDVNSLDVPYDTIELSAIYDNFCNIEHSCLPNIKVLFNKHSLVIKAAKTIPENYNISTMYTNILWGTNMRQQHVYSTKYFTCSCTRCMDPTELGTNFSSVKCLQDNCRGGYLLLKEPTKVNSDWECTRCHLVMKADDANDIISTISFEVEKMLEKSKPEIKEVEALLEKLLTVVHPHHYNCFSLKHTIIQMYGHESGYDYEHMENDLLKKKIEYCRELLFILGRLDSVGTRVPLYLVIAYYEISAALLEEMKRIVNATLNLLVVQDVAKEAKGFLTKAVGLLSEDKGNIVNSQLIMSCKKMFQEIEQIRSGQCIAAFEEFLME